MRWRTDKFYWNGITPGAPAKLKPFYFFVIISAVLTPMLCLPKNSFRQMTSCTSSSLVWLFSNPTTTWHNKWSRRVHCWRYIYRKVRSLFDNNGNGGGKNMTHAILWWWRWRHLWGPRQWKCRGENHAFGDREETHPTGIVKKRFNNQPVAKESRTREGISSQFVRLGHKYLYEWMVIKWWWTWIALRSGQGQGKWKTRRGLYKINTTTKSKWWW